MEWLITNRKMFKTEEEFLNRLEEESKKKVRKIILREKDLLNEEFEKLYLKIKVRIKGDCILIINSNIDIYKKYKEEYLHLPFKEFLKYKKKLNEKVGVSIHSLEEGIEAYKRGASYILASNIYKTECKKFKKGMGTKFIEDLKKGVKCPVIALGGITEKNKEEVIKAGADGIARMSFYK